MPGLYLLLRLRQHQHLQHLYRHARWQEQWIPQVGSGNGPLGGALERTTSKTTTTRPTTTASNNLTMSSLYAQRLRPQSCLHASYINSFTRTRPPTKIAPWGERSRKDVVVQPLAGQHSFTTTSSITTSDSTTKTSFSDSNISEKSFMTLPLSSDNLGSATVLQNEDNNDDDDEVNPVEQLNSLIDNAPLNTLDSEGEGEDEYVDGQNGNYWSDNFITDHGHLPEPFDYSKWNEMVKVSLKDLAGLIEQTRSIRHQGVVAPSSSLAGSTDHVDSRNQRAQAMELLETWFELHQKWWELQSTLRLPSNRNRRRKAAASVATRGPTEEDDLNANVTTARHNRVLLVHAMLRACHPVHDLVTLVEPQLASYFQFVQPSLEHANESSSSLALPKPLSATIVWQLGTRVMELTSQSLQAYYRTRQPPVDSRSRRHPKQQQHQRHQPTQQSLDASAAGTTTNNDTTNNNNHTIQPSDLVRLIREIPQRTQAIFERLFAISLLSPEQQQQQPTGRVNDDDEGETPWEMQRNLKLEQEQKLLQTALIHVISVWAYSHEHNRASRAEQLFQDYEHTLGINSSNSSSSSNASSVLPSTITTTTKTTAAKSRDTMAAVGEIQAEIYRLLIHAWCLDWFYSSQAAYKGTGYLTKLEELHSEANRQRPQQRSLQSSSSSSSRWNTVVVNRAHDDGSKKRKGSSLQNYNVGNPNSSSSLIGPTLEEYHMVLQAWTRDGSKHSATRAYFVLKSLIGDLPPLEKPPQQSMVDDSQEMMTTSPPAARMTTTTTTWIRPDVRCFRYVLQTAACRPLMDPLDLSRLLESCWSSMTTKLTFSPDATCYASSIRAWKFVAIHPDLQTTETDLLLLDRRTTNREKAIETILDLWQTAKRTLPENQSSYHDDDDHDDDDKSPPPHLSTLVYNDILEALTVWPVSPNGKTELAERLLLEMENSANKNRQHRIYDITTTDLRSYYGDDTSFRPPEPNARSYKLVINVWKSVSSQRSSSSSSRSNNHNNLQYEIVANAKKILWRMIEQLPQSTTYGVGDGYDGGVSDDGANGVLVKQDGSQTLPPQKQRQAQYTHKPLDLYYIPMHKLMENKIKAESDRDGFPVEVLNAFVDLCANCPIDPKNQFRSQFGSNTNQFRSPPNDMNAINNPNEDSGADNNDDHHGLIIFREALAAVESFRRRQHVQPNWETYAGLLQAANLLIPSSASKVGLQRKKEEVVERVFRLACSDGMVEESVLHALQSVTTIDQYRALVLSKSGSFAPPPPSLSSSSSAVAIPEWKAAPLRMRRHGAAVGTNPSTTTTTTPHAAMGDTALVPSEWTRQALGAGRILSWDGRNVRPLSVSGQVMETRAMKEYQMRKLRQKPGQELLRGGRWTAQDEEALQRRLKSANHTDEGSTATGNHLT